MPAYNSGTPTINPVISADYRLAALQSRAPDVAHQIWQSSNITYSFLEVGSSFSSVYGVGELDVPLQSLNAAQRDAVRQALTAWSNVANITFTEVADMTTWVADGPTTVGDIRFGFTSAVTAPSTAHAYMPSKLPQGGDIWIKSTIAAQSFSSGMSYATRDTADLFVRQGAMNYMVLLHEIGHALGLSHPFAQDGAGRTTAALPVAEDNYSNTVMSYREESGYGGLPTTPMRYDIAAIQYLYGANTSYNAGDNTYYYDIDDINYSTLWDGGGIDTLVITNDRNIASQSVPHFAVIADLREGKHIGVGFASDTKAQYMIGEAPYKYAPYRTTGRVIVADGVVIENVTTTSLSDLIYGNVANNVIDSGDGGDSIDGGAGIDTSVYSRPKSSYALGIAYDRLNFDGTGPPTTVRSVTDTFMSAGAPGYKEDKLISVERLQFADVSIAYDLDGDAGTTAKIIGAVFGAATLNNRNYVGIGLELLDGGMSYHDLMQLALDVNLGAQASNAAVVTLLYTNLVGTPPPATAMDYYEGLLASGNITQAGLGVYAADHPQNMANIDLVGLATTGIEYV
jgi:serralysin